MAQGALDRFLHEPRNERQHQSLDEDRGRGRGALRRDALRRKNHGGHNVPNREAGDGEHYEHDHDDDAAEQARRRLLFLRLIVELRSCRTRSFRACGS